MEIKRGVTPPGREGKSYEGYADVIKALKESPVGEWIAVSVGDIEGATLQRKQTVLHAACKASGLSIKTSSSKELIYLQLKTPVEQTKDVELSVEEPASDPLFKEDGELDLEVLQEMPKGVQTAAIREALKQESLAVVDLD